MSKQEVILCESLETSLGRAIELCPHDKLFVLTDEHTQRLCLPSLKESGLLKDAVEICIGAEDVHKTLETLASVWMALSTQGATRHSLLINLGGGMVTDLGGFAAATFKRGISYINIPTTLLAMVDASVGGKTGINFNGLKNEIGAFAPANSVLIETEFLRTLDTHNFFSGYAEMLKHGLISNTAHWAELLNFDSSSIDYAALKHWRPIGTSERRYCRTRSLRTWNSQSIKSRTHRRTCVRKYGTGRKPSCITWICSSLGNCVRTVSFSSQSRFPERENEANDPVYQG